MSATEYLPLPQPNKNQMITSKCWVRGGYVDVQILILIRFLSWLDVSWTPLITVLFENILPLLKWFHLQSFLPQKKNLVKEIQAKRAQTTLRQMRVHKRNFFSCFQPALRHPTLGYHMNIRISYQQWTMFTLPNFAKPPLTMTTCLLWRSIICGRTALV